MPKDEVATVSLSRPRKGGKCRTKLILIAVVTWLGLGSASYVWWPLWSIPIVEASSSDPIP